MADPKGGEWRTQDVAITRSKGRILRNAAQCAICQDIIESVDVHDFVRCECGAIFVDGGHEYLRRGGKFDALIELSEVEGEDNATSQDQ